MIKIIDELGYTAEQHADARAASFNYWILRASYPKNVLHLELAGVRIKPMPTSEFELPSWVAQALQRAEPKPLETAPAYWRAWACAMLGLPSHTPYSDRSLQLQLQILIRGKQ